MSNCLLISPQVTGSEAGAGKKILDGPTGKDLPPSVRSCPPPTGVRSPPPGLAFSSLVPAQGDIAVTLWREKYQGGKESHCSSV